MHTPLLPCRTAGRGRATIRRSAGRGAVAGLVVAVALELAQPSPLQQGVQHGLRALAVAATTAVAPMATLP